MNTKELKALIRNGDYAWPGGYPIVAVFSDGNVCRPSSLKKDFASVYRSTRDRSNDGFRVVGFDVFYEGAPEFDAITNEEIESAYGDPDKSENLS